MQDADAKQQQLLSIITIISILMGYEYCIRDHEFLTKLPRDLINAAKWRATFKGPIAEENIALQSGVGPQRPLVPAVRIQGQDHVEYS
jgi:hypothetical protein